MNKNEQKLNEAVKQFNEVMKVAQDRSENINQRIRKIQDKIKKSQKKINDTEKHRILDRIDFSMTLIMKQNNKNKIVTPKKNTFEIDEENHLTYRQYRRQYRQDIKDRLETEILSEFISTGLIITEDYKTGMKEIIEILNKDDNGVDLERREIKLISKDVRLNDFEIQLDDKETTKDSVRNIEYLEGSSYLNDECHNKVLAYLDEAEKELKEKLNKNKNPLDRIKEEMDKLGKYFLMKEFLTDY